MSKQNWKGLAFPASVVLLFFVVYFLFPLLMPTRKVTVDRLLQNPAKYQNTSIEVSGVSGGTVPVRACMGRRHPGYLLIRDSTVPEREIFTTLTNQFPEPVVDSWGKPVTIQGILRWYDGIADCGGGRAAFWYIETDDYYKILAQNQMRYWLQR